MINRINSWRCSLATADQENDVHFNKPLTNDLIFPAVGALSFPQLYISYIEKREPKHTHTNTHPEAYLHAHYRLAQTHWNWARPPDLGRQGQRARFFSLWFGEISQHTQLRVVQRKAGLQVHKNTSAEISYRHWFWDVHLTSFCCEDDLFHTTSLEPCLLMTSFYANNILIATTSQCMLYMHCFILASQHSNSGEGIMCSIFESEVILGFERASRFPEVTCPDIGRPGLWSEHSSRGCVSRSQCALLLPQCGDRCVFLLLCITHSSANLAFYKTLP